MKNAIIIGAGPAGLTAAYELHKKSPEWTITILEESNAIGGISQTIVHDNCRIDVGGHRFFSKSNIINELWNELMPIQGKPAKDDLMLGRECHVEQHGPDPEKEECVMLRRHRVSRIYFRRHFLDYPISLKPATFAAMGPALTWKAGWSYIHSLITKRPEKSLEDFYINRFGKVLYSMFFEDYTEKLWGIHPSKISPEWGAQRVKGLSLWKALANIFVKSKKKETSLIDEFLYPKRGPGQLWELIADKLRQDGVSIIMNAKVTGLSTSQGLVKTISLADGSSLPCDAVFSSMPIKDLVAACDNVPQDVACIAAALPYRDFITVGLLVDKLAIENKTKLKTINNLVPDTWIYVQERDVQMGRIQIFNNWSPYMVDDVSKHVWIGLEYFCTEGDQMWTMEDVDFINMATKELRQIGILEENEPIHKSIRIKIKKAYPAYFGSYAQFGKVREWLDQFDNLYCIGRNGQHRYNNMDHSMLCGIEAVHALLGEIDKKNVWNINTETEYHESK
ncbi:MAG: NAD(P)/FAD-dependent oxidoreductase [Lentisphaeria bacterium]|nr:NAD(P)/FAD-dependent oxidoreductase [Victivallales bacterium]MCR4575248.1 NAD(P)/FAD-dependent oxidoreductase [Lentisphaeria bacterium]